MLFLDCTWQLLRQFPAAFGFTEAYLLALHDSAFLPYCSTFLFSCQRQRGRGGVVSGVARLSFPFYASASPSVPQFPFRCLNFPPSVSPLLPHSLSGVG